MPERFQAEARALLPLTIPEIRRLLWRLVYRRPVPRLHPVLWSLWRRWHQAEAQRHHYNKRRSRDA